MRYSLTFAALMLPLAGCVVAPPQPSPYGYPPPGDSAAYGQQDLAYPGYAYNGGSPTLVVEGVTWPLIFYGGGWGYWDGYHRWHGAPGAVARHLEMRHPGGVGYRPYGGGQFGRPVGFNGRPGNYGPPGGVRPGQPGAQRPVAGQRPAAAPNRPAPQRRREDEHR